MVISLLPSASCFVRIGFTVRTRRGRIALLHSAAGERGAGEVQQSKHLFSVAPMMDWTDNHFRMLARIMSRYSWLYTEMVVAETIIHKKCQLDRLLEFPASQHPIVLQLGGSDSNNLAIASKLASTYGYDEINLNCGCPSNAVAEHGCFGARLMLSPWVVGEAVEAMASQTTVPITVKCRIGVDDVDSYEQLCEFVETVSSTSPTRHFIVHARKALLNGITPAKNRTVPPLKYEYVLALLRDFPHLQFTLNGGINSVEQVNAILKMGLHGVMVGRAAYNSPWATLGNVDSVIYGQDDRQITRRQVLKEYEVYAESVIGKYGPHYPTVRHVAKPLMHMFHGEKGSCFWKRAIDESLKHAKTFHQVMEDCLKEVTDTLLDAPPSIPSPSDELCIGALPNFSQPATQIQIACD